MSTTTGRTAPTPTTGRALNRRLWTVQVVVALFMLVGAAGPKLLGEQTAVQIFTEIGAGQWFRYLVGGLELAGAVGLLIAPLAGAAAAGLAGLMVGAVFTQVVVLDAPINAITPAVLGLLMVWVAVCRRERTAALLRSLRRQPRTRA
jgi:hypothetical protein